MVRRFQLEGGAGRKVAMMLVLVCAGVRLMAQTTPGTAPTVPNVTPTVQKEPSGKASKQSGVTTQTEIKQQAPAPQMPAVQGTQLDRVVAIVNGDLILDSDVDQEKRFAALLPYGEAAGAYSRDEAVERLINRDLILQQVKLQPGDDVTTEAAQKDLDALRKALPTCKEFHCETQEGWDRFLASQGFTDASLVTLWQQRMEVLAFIEQRFRMGIKVTPEEIKAYYEKTMLPVYAQQHVAPPTLDTLSKRIQEVLLQQRVSNLLDSWLQSLRAQGSVVVLHPGEEAP